MIQRDPLHVRDPLVSIKAQRARARSYIGRRASGADVCSLMLPSFVSWRVNESRSSAPVQTPSPNTVSVAAIDAMSTSPNPPTMSQSAPEALGTQPAGPEGEPASVAAMSAGANPATENSYPRHDTYYFKDGNVTFLVDGTLYCVHRYFFYRDSIYFSTKFAKLDIRDHEPLRTIVSLDDVERKDFEAFLSVLYPENFDEHSLSYEQWRSVLHLSTRWGFASLRKLALRSVKPPTACDQLLLARTYGVDHWVLPALSALCERTTPISIKEARQMSIEDIVLVATVREDICHHGSQTEIPLRIETTKARIADATPRIKVEGAEKQPDLKGVVTTGSGAIGDSDSSSRTAATTSPEDGDKHVNDEHEVSLSAVQIKTQVIDETRSSKAGSAVKPLDHKPQEVEQQIQEAKSENSSEAPRAPGDDTGADQVKLETIRNEEPRIANTLSEEPEAQEQTERPVRAASDGGAQPRSRSSSLLAPLPEAQAPTRATPMYWRRLTARYVPIGPAAS
ncbi:hypothetical protein F5148DRAFT_1235268 [Russula earlei]|uniref:Uncharacterized protein n=1 Tax=Russula earlei TaxID=71964 RepID=A0ACC0TYQ0_9AGAM|nr:hypothetical protein F5148DRAFT_1235268 [Russula earlei]